MTENGFAGTEGSSIADMLRAAANEVLHANVPEGFEWIEEYGQFYSRTSRYFYDPNNGLFYSADNMTYYRFNEGTYQYDVVECRQPTKWSSSGFRKRAITSIGEAEFKKFNQDNVDICESIFGMIGRIAKEEHLASVKDGEASTKPQVEKKAEKPKEEITAEDIRMMMRKRKRGHEEEHEDTEDHLIFDERTGDFRQVKMGYGGERHIPKEESSEDEDGECGYDGDERAALMKEEGFDEAPLLRIIDKNRRLHIVTICGGYVGSDTDCEVVLANTLLPERCVEILYSEEINGYTATKIDESCVVMFNASSLQFEKTVDICHGDVLNISGEKLEIHVHFGNNTCPSCEPGLFVEEKAEETPAIRRINAEVARRKNLKKMMASYGITPDESLSAPIRRDKKPEIAGPSHMNIVRNDPYGGCAAKPVPESQRRFALPESASSSKQTPTVEKPIDSGNVGFKLLKSMGWTEGKGLGKEQSGIVAPISADVKTNRQGLGSAKETAEKLKSLKERILEKTKQRFEEKR